jgi:hypothetical protein
MESRIGGANATDAESINLKRLFWVGPLTVVTSALAVFLIRTVAVAILKPAAAFLPLSMETPLFDTVALSTAAVFVFLAKCRYGLEPVREYRALALKALAISLLPDVALATMHGFGGGWPEALALMAMHVAVWAICVTILPGLVATKSQHRRNFSLPPFSF